MPIIKQSDLAQPAQPAQGGGDPSSTGGDLIPSLQRSFDANTKTDPNEPLLETGLKSVVGAVGTPFIHPMKTLNSLGDFINPDTDKNPIVAGARSVKEDYDSGGLPYAATKLSGNIAGGVALGGAGEASLGATRSVIPRMGQLGEGMQDLAASNLNRKYPPTLREMERGNNPGRGMLDAGIGPTLSRANLANKVAGATEAVGGRIGDVVNRADNNVFAPTITPEQLQPAIRGPIQEQLSVVNGPGGTSPDTPYQTLHESMGLRAPGAKNPIYGPNAPAAVPPSDLWATIKNVDKNTRFNTDPEVENVNETRRDIRSNLRPVLESTDPTLKPLSRMYGDLRSAGTAIERSQSPMRIPHGLSGIIDSTVDSVPVNTTVSSALNRIGGGLKNMATNAPEWMGGKGGSPSVLPFSYRMVDPPLGLPDDVPGNADYGPRSMSAGGFPGRSPVSPPPPIAPMALPAEAGGGEVQPMVGIRAPQHPGVAEDYARTRIAPSRAQLNRMGGTTLPAETEGLQLGSGPVMRALPETAGGGEAEPMVGIRRVEYPPLAEPFAKTRIRPNVFSEASPIQNNPFEAALSGNVYGNAPRGPRELPSPTPKAKKGKG